MGVTRAVVPPVVEHAGLRDRARDPARGQRVDDARTREDAEVRQRGRGQRRTVRRALAFRDEDQAELARGGGGGGGGGRQEAEEKVFGWHAAGEEGLRVRVADEAAEEVADDGGVLLVELHEGLGAGEDDGGGDAAGREGQVDAGRGDAVDDEVGVSEESGKGIAEDEG